MMQWTLKEFHFDRIVQVCLMGYLFVFSIPHTAALRSILLGIMMIVMVIKGISTRKFPVVSKSFNIIILLLAALTLLKVVTSIDPDYSFKFFLNEFLKQVLVFYLITSTIKTKLQIKHIIMTIFASGIILAVIGILGFWEGNMIKNFRATSYLASPGRAAFYISLIFPLLWGYLLFNLRNYRKLVLIVPALIVQMMFMVITMARGAWVSIIIVMLLMTAFKNHRLLVIVIIGLLLSIWFMPGNVLDRAESIFRFDEMQGTTTYGDRFWMWLSATEMIKDRPLLGAGYGLKIFQQLYPYYMNSRCSGFVYDNAHNQFIQFAVEMGLVGLLLFSILIFRSFQIAWITYKKMVDSDERGYVIGIGGSMLVFIIYSLSSVRYENEIGILFWYLLAILNCFFSLETVKKLSD